MGRPTIWAGSKDIVSIWDVKSKSAIKSKAMAGAGMPDTIVEIGENTALVGYDGGAKIFDLNNNSI